MELKKATQPTINYPSKTKFKPLLVGMGMAVFLTACTNTSHQEPIVKESPKYQIEEPINVAGGIPAHIPEGNSPVVNKFKK